MAGLATAAADAAKQAVKDVLCGLGGIQRALNDANGKINPYYSGSRGEAVTRRIESGLRGFCDLPPPNGYRGGPAFTGGQCDGYQYRVGFSIRTFYADGTPGFPGTGASSVGDTITPPVFGPLGGAWVVNEFVSPGTASKLTRYTIYMATKGGIVQMFSSTAQNTFWEIVGVSTRVASGDPDVCGDPSPNPPPPPPPPPANPQPPTRENPGVVINPQITVPVFFTPLVGIISIDARGNLIVPVSVRTVFTVGGITNDINIPIIINISDPTAPPIFPPVAPPNNPDGRPELPDCPIPDDCQEPPAVDPEPNPPDLDPSDPDDPKEKEVKGAIVLGVGGGLVRRATQIYMGGVAPNIFAPRIGSIKFVYQDENGSKVWSSDIDVKALNQVVGAPKNGLRCLGATFHPSDTVEAEVFLIYGNIGSCG